MSSPARAARLPRNERREHLLDVAADLVVERGIDSVTMEGVAAAAGVSKGLGYAYFANSSELLLALLRRESNRLGSRIVGAMAGATTFEDKLRSAIHEWFSVVEESGVLFARLLQATWYEGPHVEEWNAYLKQRDRFWAVLAEEELGVPRQHGEVATAILMAGLQGIVQRWSQSGDDPEMLEDVFMKIAVAGLENLRP
jgi:AcrR family transcriptional regulator